MSASQFSYAQAARGQGATQSTGQTDVNNGLPAGSTTSSAPSTTPSTALSVISNDADGVDQQSGQPDKATPGVNTQTTTDDESTAKPSSIQAPSVVGQDEKTQPADSSTPSSEKKAKWTVSSVRGTDPSDAKKAGKKARKPKTSEKDSEAEQAADQEKETEAPPQPQPPLADAPLPTVNAWTQRAQAAKTMLPATSAGPVQTPTNSSKPTQAPGQQTADAKLAKQNAASGSESNGAQARQPVPVKNQKRASETPRDGSRAAPRGSRLAEKSERETAEPLASVADPSSWPTPETAATEMKVQEKHEKQPEKDDAKDDNKTEAGANQKRKNWVPVPFVPSVNFKTPIRGGRGGRGGSRGGREAGGRGNHAGSASFSERTPGSTKTPEATGDMSSASKRASVDASMGSRDIRKPFHAAADSAKSTINGKAEPFKPAQNTLSSSASDQHQHGAAENAKETGPKAEHGSRVPDAQREPAHPSSKNAAFQSNSRPEGNPRERRGGGGHRGRGGHSGANSQGHHAAFASNGHHFPVALGGRQNSYGQPNHPQMYGAPFPGGPAPGYRGPNRSQSTSSASYHPRGQANGSKGYRPPPVHTSHPYDMHHPASAMTAPMMPYYPNESMAAMPILKSQVQYYFSLENLCKDMFLRKHMDSQGFVFLEVISNFKRIQDLTSDMDMIRGACVEAETVDLVVGQDGRERLRSHQGWEQWILPKSERHEPAKHDDGPTAFHPRQHPYAFAYQMMAAPYGVDPNAVYSPSNVESPYGNFVNDASYGHHMSNGMNGFAAAGDSRLSAAVPEFSPNGQTGQDVPAYMVQPTAATNGEAGPSTNGVHAEASYTNGAGASHEAESH